MTSFDPGEAVLDLSSVSKQYGGLRPLRIENLTVMAAQQIALLGLDQPTAEVFVNLVTGASLPDTGVVRVFGRQTADIADSADWLSTLDQFGIVSDRAALLGGLSVVQNLAIPFSLEIEPPAADVREHATRLANEVGLPEKTWERPVAELDGASRVRVRLGRALALNPPILLLEHPTVTVSRQDVAMLGRDVRAVAERRGAAVISVTMDRDFATAVSTKVLTLEPATGRIREGRFGKISFWS